MEELSTLSLSDQIPAITWIILKNWWWVITPIILFSLLQFFYLWWIRWEVWYKKRKWIMLKIKPPKEILKSFKAMEDIFNVIWSLHDVANWRERWCEGEFACAPYWASLEIVSLGGEIYFFIRCLKEHRGLIESAIFAHYSDVEISLAEDYTKNVPKDIPNKDWDLYGEDYCLLREDAYPIRTYSQFFEPAGERVLRGEEKLDPLYSLLEDMSKLKSGEQFWFQIIIAPVLDRDIPWITRGKELIDKLARRPVKPKPRSIFLEALEVLFFGRPGEIPSAPQEVVSVLSTGKSVEVTKKEKKEDFFPPELKLTPGEREILHDVETKISKRGFRVNIRGFYVAKRDVFFRPNRIIARRYLQHFATIGSNTFLYWIKTRPRIHYWFRKRRIYLRKRKIFRNYINRFPPLYPRPPGKGTFILNTEELATIFHFPSKVIVPTMPYVEAKKGGPPPELPVG